MTTSNTNTNDPDALRAEIEQTRANLSQNVNALGEAVQPSNIAKRQVSKVTGAATGLKDKVMGSAEGAASSVGDRASGVGNTVSGVGGSVSDSVSNAGQTAKAQAQGNPMAAGLIALGAGWLLGSLLPASSREREAASAVKEQATPLIGQAKEVAKETAEELKEPAMSAAESVKTTAQDAAETVKAEGQSAAENVRSSAQDSKENVQQHQSSPGTSL
jgi:gas vesicle protein